MIKLVTRLSFWTHVLRFSLVIAGAWSVWEGNWAILFVIILTLGLTYIHLLFQRYRIIIPPIFQFILVFFIYASLFLGDINELYYRFWWWDTVLHGFAGLALGFIGFLIPYIFYKVKEFRAPPIMIVLFGFCFAVALGALWEITEYILDLSFGLDMQKARNLGGDTHMGVVDTMNDLILDTLGALAASIFGYIFLKNGEQQGMYKRLIDTFERYNTWFYDKRDKFLGK